MLTFTILTLFPEMFPGPLAHALSGKAMGHLWQCRTLQLRDFADNKHNRVDDEPFGGGPGMVIRAEVVTRALEYAGEQGWHDHTLIHLTPRGRPLTPQLARQLAASDNLTLLCGRYEAIDQRAFDYYNQQHPSQPVIEISIGDFILSGGELAALVLMDVILRFLPGVIGKEASLSDESHENGLLEHHHYTRPALWRGLKVPEILLTGDHKNIKDWRRQEAVRLTMHLRPDMAPSPSRQQKLPAVTLPKGSVKGSLPEGSIKKKQPSNE